MSRKRRVPVNGLGSESVAEGLTLVQELLLHTRFQRPSKGVLADEFEVLGHVVHFLAFQVGDNDEDVVASMIVHPPQEHQFRKL